MNDTTILRSVRYGSVSAASVEAERHLLQEYVSDLLALERHIREPIARQARLDVTPGNAVAMRIIARLDLMTDVHIEALQVQLRQLDGDAASRVGSALAVRTGFGTSAVDSIRSEKTSQRLRDNYAQLSLAAISYTILNTVAIGFGDGSAAALAKRHLTDVASVLVEINRILPGVILQELRDEGLAITPESQHSMLLRTRDTWIDSGT